jgi:DNA-binding beta-propeller fold protein YncE
MRAITTALILAAALAAPSALAPIAHAQDSSSAAAKPAAAKDAPPQFKVDPFWPKPLPNNWIIGQASGVDVDPQDNVWIIHRYRRLEPDEKAAATNPPTSKCCIPAPPVLVFNPAGEVIKSWGGPGEGYEWPEMEHGMYIDPKGFVWLGGNGKTDGVVLKFTQDGKFVMQIGKNGPLTNSQDTTRLGQAADFVVDPEANEVYIADGYYNHRVIVFDSETGAFKRMWGAYGKPPTDEKIKYDPAKPPSQQFGNPVHCVKLAKDGLLYVCDRTNNRIQVFKKDGTFVKEFIIEKNTLRSGSMWNLAFSKDPGQKYLFNADGSNNEVRTLDRESGAVLSTFGQQGRNAGFFHWVHNLALDSKGNIYTTEVGTGERVQKFMPAK